MSSEDTAGTRPSGRGRVALGAVLVVLVLAVAGGAVWFFMVPLRATPAPPPSSTLPHLANERVLPLPSGDWRRPTWRPDGRALVASKEEGGKSQLWLVPLDGSHPIQHTFGPGAHVASPGRAWRAERLLYASDEKGQWDIWMMDTKTLKASNLGLPGGEETDPVFSPDGKSIAFSSRGFGEDRGRIGRMPVSAGSGAVLWDVSAPATGDATCPQWSPDGDWIMFGLGSEAGRDIWLVRPTYSEPTSSASSAGVAQPPTATVSATGTPPPSEPVTVPIVEATATVLLATRGDQCDAVWSDEAGKEVVFSDTETSTAPADLFIFSNGLVGRLTDTPEAEHSPSVSPDGRRLAFERGEVGNRVLVLADLVRDDVAR